MTDQYNNEVKIGDILCWAPARRCVRFGKVVDVSGENPKVKGYWRGVEEIGISVVKTSVFYIIPGLPKVMTNAK